MRHSGLRSTVAGILFLCGMGSTSGQSTVPWPDQAYERGLPRPDWVLAIPARRASDGSLTIWDRNDPWTSAWRVPITVDGLRIVTLFGDTEDRRSITPDAIDGMLVDQMQPVMEKYGAPALALIVDDGSGIALAGYVPGYPASWTLAAETADTEETRKASADLLASLFNGAVTAPVQVVEYGVVINAYRQDEFTGETDYRVTVSGSWEQINAQLDAISIMPSTSIVSEAALSETQVEAVVRRAPGATPFESDLGYYGLLR